VTAGNYQNGIDEIMAGNIDLENSRIAVWLIDTSSYTVDLANHTSQSDVPDAAIIDEAVLTNKTIDDSTYRADDTVFSSVTSTSTVNAVLVFLDEDTKAASTLIYYNDEAPEFPITPDGTNITVNWDTGVNGIFKL
jgi:hypothetical protein